MAEETSNTTPDISHPSKRNILIALPTFLKYLFRLDDEVTLDQETAYLLRALDPEELMYHIEFPSQYGLVTGPNPKVYLLKAWKQSNENHIKQKLHSEIERQQRFNRAENEKKIMAQLKKLTGIREEDKLMPIVNTIMKNPANAKQFGIDLTELKVDLSETKRQFGIS